MRLGTVSGCRWSGSVRPARCCCCSLRPFSPFAITTTGAPHTQSFYTRSRNHVGISTNWAKGITYYVSNTDGTMFYYGTPATQRLRNYFFLSPPKEACVILEWNIIWSSVYALSLEITKFGLDAVWDPDKCKCTWCSVTLAPKSNFNICLNYVLSNINTQRKNFSVFKSFILSRCETTNRILNVKSVSEI